MKVTVFRDLPTERWWSMERYADELTRALRTFDCDVESYVLPRPLARWRGSTNALANLAWRSLAYPLTAHFHQGEVNHIIDHSYAHLLTTLDVRRTVVTCHDIAPLVLNEGRGLSRRMWEYSFRMMLRAAHIISDSEFTRAEISRVSNYPRERITVAPLAVSDDFFAPVADADVQAVRAQYHLTGRRLVLHVGSCAPRKNVELILHALASMPDTMLVQIGGTFTERQMCLIHALDLPSRVIQLPWVSETELRLWYHAADVFVFPSLYEGFGLPVLEAMACGTPVVCARTGAPLEVIGSAVLSPNIDGPAPFADMIRQVLTNSQIGADLRGRGYVQACKFSWKRTARATLAVYQNLKVG